MQRRRHYVFILKTTFDPTKLILFSFKRFCQSTIKIFVAGGGMQLWWWWCFFNFIIFVRRRRRGLEEEDYKI
jgi:hypothetical protein